MMKQKVPFLLPSPLALWVRRFLVILISGIGLALSTQAAQAQLSPDDPFTELLTRRAPSAVELSTGEPQLFETTEGAETFLFQAQGNTALIRYLCDEKNIDALECQMLNGQAGEEVYVLNAKRSPRGDVTYKDVQGVTVLRVTANGGATLFQPVLQPNGAEQDSFRNGSAVLPVVGADVTLQIPHADRAMVEERLRLASDLLYQRHTLFIPFVAPGKSNDDNAMLADTILTTAKAIDMIASDPLGAQVLAERLDLIEISRGVRGEAYLDGKTLKVTYDPEWSFRGRPSSVIIARYLEANL